MDRPGGGGRARAPRFDRLRRRATHDFLDNWLSGVAVSSARSLPPRAARAERSRVRLVPYRRGPRGLGDRRHDLELTREPVGPGEHLRRVLARLVSAPHRRVGVARPRPGAEVRAPPLDRRRRGDAPRWPRPGSRCSCSPPRRDSKAVALVADFVDFAYPPRRRDPGRCDLGVMALMGWRPWSHVDGPGRGLRRVRDRGRRSTQSTHSATATAPRPRSMPCGPTGMALIAYATWFPRPASSSR